MEIKTLYSIVRSAIVKITGDGYVEPEYGKTVLSLFYNSGEYEFRKVEETGEFVTVKGEFVPAFNYETTVKILKDCVFSYEGKTKVPPPKFWEGVVRKHRHEIGRQIRASQGYAERMGYKKPEGEEAQKISEIASKLARQFSSGKVEIKIDPFNDRAQRYRERAERDEVRIDDKSRSDHGEWVKRSDLERLGQPSFHCPKTWLSRHCSGGSFGNTIDSVLNDIEEK